MGFKSTAQRKWFFANLGKIRGGKKTVIGGILAAAGIGVGLKFRKKFGGAISGVSKSIKASKALKAVKNVPKVVKKARLKHQGPIADQFPRSGKGYDYDGKLTVEDILPSRPAISYKLGDNVKRKANYGNYEYFGTPRTKQGQDVGRSALVGSVKDAKPKLSTVSNSKRKDASEEIRSKILKSGVKVTRVRTSNSQIKANVFNTNAGTGGREAQRRATEGSRDKNALKALIKDTPIKKRKALIEKLEQDGFRVTNDMLPKVRRTKKVTVVPKRKK